MEIKRYFSFFSGLHLNYYRTIHGVKTAIACLIGLAIEKYYDWPMGQWVPITIMVVMSAQPHFGAAVRKAYMRFLGTVSGVALVVTTLWFFGDSNIAVIFGTVFFASIIFAYIASSHGDINYAGTLGGVTVILILTGQQVGIITAIQRGGYIIVGIIISLLVSRLIFPIHARDRLRYHVATALRNLGKFYSITIKLSEKEKRDDDDATATELNTKVSSDIAVQPRLIHEAVAGSIAFAAKKSTFNEILNSEHNLKRLINLLNLDLLEVESPFMIKNKLATVDDLHTIISDSLSYLADCFEAREQPQNMVNLDEALTKITLAVENLPKTEIPKHLIAEHSFLFFMEHILKELEKLRKLIAKVNSKDRDNMV